MNIENVLVLTSIGLGTLFGVMLVIAIRQRYEIRSLRVKSDEGHVKRRMDDWKATAEQLAKISRELEETSESAAIARLRLQQKLVQAWTTAQRWPDALDCLRDLLKACCGHLGAGTYPAHQYEMISLAKWSLENYLLYSRAAKESAKNAVQLIVDVRNHLEHVSEGDPRYEIISAADKLLKALAEKS